MTHVVLASASPRRKELLAALLTEFDVVPSKVDESPVPEDPVQGAVALAVQKARAVAGRHPDAVVIGADTVVHDGTRDYSKPHDAADAIATLKALRGRDHRVVTGVAVILNGEERTATSIATVRLCTLGDEAIAHYVASGRPLDKAGAYAIQDEDVPTVERLDGCYCSVMGLPLWTLRGLLRDAGVDSHDPGRSISRCACCPDRP